MALLEGEVLHFEDGGAFQLVPATSVAAQSAEDTRIDLLLGTQVRVRPVSVCVCARCSLTTLSVCVCCCVAQGWRKFLFHRAEQAQSLDAKLSEGANVAQACECALWVSTCRLCAVCAQTRMCVNSGSQH